MSPQDIISIRLSNLAQEKFLKDLKSGLDMAMPINLKQRSLREGIRDSGTQCAHEFSTEDENSSCFTHFIDLTSGVEVETLGQREETLKADERLDALCEGQSHQRETNDSSSQFNLQDRCLLNEDKPILPKDGDVKPVDAEVDRSDSHADSGERGRSVGVAVSGSMSQNLSVNLNSQHGGNVQQKSGAKASDFKSSGESLTVKMAVEPRQDLQRSALWESLQGNVEKQAGSNPAELTFTPFEFSEID